MKQNFFLIFIIISFLLLGGIGIKPLLGPYGDNARYLVLAQSLLKKKGMRLINYPHQPPEPKVPIGYPLVLATVMTLFGQNFVLLKCSSLFFMAAGFFTFYFVLRGYNFYGLSTILVLMTAIFNMHFLEHSRDLFVEPLFILLFMLVCLFMAKYEQGNKKLYLKIAFILSLITFFVRQIGVILLLAEAIVLARRKERLLSLFFVIVFLCLVAFWIFQNMQLENTYLKEFLSQGSYLLPSPKKITFFSLIKRYSYETLVYLGDIVIDFLFPLAGYIKPRTNFWALKIFFSLSACGLTLFGFLRLPLLHRKSFLAITSILYALCLPLFPTYGIRYLLPIGLVIIFYFVWGIRNIKLPRAIILVIVILLVIGNLFSAISDLFKPQRIFSDSVKNFYAALEFLKKNVSPAVIVCRKPYLGYIISGHKTLGFSTSTDVAYLYQEMINQGATHVIVDNIDIAGINLTRKYVEPVVRTFKSNFRLIYRLEHPLTEVYEIIR
ncbi:MAG: hypothetical protein N2606_04815 [Candidatus Omnitrophica bacterium]|nr:hypothetical protein [Candidatus Omnitrophota bacterium]